VYIALNVMGMALRALALAVGIAASVAMFIEQAMHGRSASFVRTNTMTWPDRWRLLWVMAAAIVLVGTVGALTMWRHGAESVRRWNRLSRRLAPAVLLGPLCPLLEPWSWEPLPAAIALSVFVLLAERTFRTCLDAGPPVGGGGRMPAGAAARREGHQTPSGALGIIARNVLGARRAGGLERIGPPVIVAASVAGYAIYMSVFTVWSHQRFGTYGYDLGQYNAIFWSTLHGKPLRCSPLNLVENWSELSNHADLAVFALLPFYAIRPGAEILLVMQSTIIALGAIPIYRFAARLLPRGQAVTLALVYLSYPPLHGSNFYDFHFQPIAATFVLATIDFLDERRDWLAVPAFLIALACREDISVGLAFLGVFLALSGRRPIAGLLVAAGASTYFVAMRFAIMPAIGTAWFADIYKDLAPEGRPGFGGVIATLLSNPAYVFRTLLTADKLRYALQILLPVAFLPLRRPYLVLAVIPGAIFTVLTTRYAPTTSISFQYSGHFTPYVFPAAALALAAYRRDLGGPTRGRAAFGALVLGSLLATAYWGAIPPRPTILGGFDEVPMRAPTVEERQYERDLLELDALIPASASVAVSDRELPHISRMNLFSLRDGLFDSDYVLYDPMSSYLGADNAEEALATGELEQIASRPGLALLKRVAVPSSR